MSADEKIDALEKELKKAIESENYEECAAIRDKIRALRQGQ